MLIAQLCDAHVVPKGTLYGNVADFNGALASAISHLESLVSRPDLILITGDIVVNGAPQ